MADLIGMARCPLCSSEKARLGLSKKQWAYLTCQGCGSQIFARHTRSDDALRKLLVKKDEPTPAADAAPAAQAAPIPAAMPTPPAKEPEKRKRSSWDEIYG